MTGRTLEDAIGELGPGHQLRWPVGDHLFVIMLTDEVGMHSGRSRYLVACASCEELCHEGTTGPGEHVRWHVEKKTRAAVSAVTEKPR